MLHSYTDELRSTRQHQFLEAKRSKTRQPSTVFSPSHAVEKMVRDLKRGNLTEDQMFALANFARDLPRENINIETLPSEEGPSFVTIKPEKAAEVIQRMFYPNQSVALNIDAPSMGSAN